VKWCFSSLETMFTNVFLFYMEYTSKNQVHFQHEAQIFGIHFYMPKIGRTISWPVNPCRPGCFLEGFRSAWRKNFVGSNERYMYVVSSCQRVLKATSQQLHDSGGCGTPQNALPGDWDLVPDFLTSDHIIYAPRQLLRFSIFRDRFYIYP